MPKPPNKPPSHFEEFAGNALYWWLGETLHARCGGVDIVLHYHPQLFPETPWSVEIFGTKNQDEFFHYSGKQLAKRPTSEQFQAIARSFLEALQPQGDL